MFLVTIIVRLIYLYFSSLASKFYDSGTELSMAYQKFGIASFHMGFYNEAKAAFVKSQQVSFI